MAALFFINNDMTLLSLAAVILLCREGSGMPLFDDYKGEIDVQQNPSPNG